MPTSIVFEITTICVACVNATVICNEMTQFEGHISPYVSMFALMCLCLPMQIMGKKMSPKLKDQFDDAVEDANEAVDQKPADRLAYELHDHFKVRQRP